MKPISKLWLGYVLIWKLIDCAIIWKRWLKNVLASFKENLLDFVTAIAAPIEVRDPYNAGHQRRVANLATAIARELQLSEDQVAGLTLASVLHDIGKIRIPAEILSKPGWMSWNSASSSDTP